MIERKTLPVDDQYSINVVTERMNDGSWAVVAAIEHRTPTGEKVIDLPVRDTRYRDQVEAEDAGVRQARDWLDRNVSHAA
jgi:hypothetical protein